jgi:hypothetical protein
MRAEVCVIHGVEKAPFGGDCCACLREKCARRSDEIMSKLGLVVEADDSPEGSPEGPPDALGSDSTRLNDQTLVKV